MDRNIVIRADGSSHIGTGHVMRCLALAQGWNSVIGNAIFAQAQATTALEKRLRSEKMQCYRIEVPAGSGDDAQFTIRLARESEALCVVADGYDFGAEWQRQVKQADLKLLIIDDCGHADHYYADLVLNQNLSASEDYYASREPFTHLLLGTSYALLRHEFLQWRGWNRVVPAVARKVLVTLGGSDVHNVTGKVIHAVAGLSEFEVVVVVGGSNPNLDSLASTINTYSPAMRLVVNPTNMPSLMAWADIAVAAAGSTAWELSFFELPTITIVLADNQIAIASALERRGVTTNLGACADVDSARIASALYSLANDFEQRAAMGKGGRELVDGLGVERVVSRLNSLFVTS